MGSRTLARQDGCKTGARRGLVLSCGNSGKKYFPVYVESDQNGCLFELDRFVVRVGVLEFWKNTV